MTQINRHLAMVRKFHDAFGYEQDVGTLTRKQFYSRPSFIAEEMAEFLRDKASGNRAGQLDAMCDLAYFALGTLAILGEDVVEEPICEQHDLNTAFLRLMEAHFNLVIPDDFNNYAYANKQDYLHKRDAATEVLASLCSGIYFRTIIETENVLSIDADFEGAFAEVQRSNMSKLGLDGKPIYSDAGKIMKGPNFSEPELAQFLR